MKWQKERDELIAQTKAFVQSVTGRTPQAVLGPVFGKPAPLGNPFAAPVPDPVLPPPLPVANVVTPKSTAITSTETWSIEVKSTGIRPIEAAPAEPTIDMSAIKAPAQVDVRKEIQTRVAAFQAHQHRFHRERDAYFNSVLTKARSSIQDGPDTTSS